MSADSPFTVSTSFPRPIIAGKHAGSDLVKLIKNKTVVWSMDDEKYLASLHTFSDSEEGWKPSYLNDYHASDGWYYYNVNGGIQLANVKQRRTKLVVGLEVQFVEFGTTVETRYYPIGNGAKYDNLPIPEPRAGWQFLGWDSIYGGYFLDDQQHRRFVTDNDVVRQVRQGGDYPNVFVAIWRPLRCLPNGAILTFGINQSQSDSGVNNDVDMLARHRMFIDGKWYKLCPAGLESRYENFTLIRSYPLQESRYIVGINLRRSDISGYPVVSRYRDLTGQIGSTSSSPVTTGVLDTARLMYDHYNVLTGEITRRDGQSYQETGQYIKTAFTYVLTKPSANDPDGYHQLLCGTKITNANGGTNKEHSCLSNAVANGVDYSVRNTLGLVQTGLGEYAVPTDGISPTITLTAKHDLILPSRTVMRIYDFDNNLVYQRSFNYSDTYNFVTGILWIFDNRPYYENFSYSVPHPDYIAWCSVGVKSVVEGVWHEDIEFSFDMLRHRMEFEYI